MINLDMTNEEIISEFRKELNKTIITEPDPRYQQLLKEYKQKIDNDFKEEWSKKRFKWFFKKRRQRKLRNKMMHRYAHPIFVVLEDCIEDILSKTINESIENFVDIKDITLGEPNYFVEENIK